jgi:hypothetical protein
VTVWRDPEVRQIRGLNRLGVRHRQFATRYSHEGDHDTADFCEQQSRAYFDQVRSRMARLRAIRAEQIRSEKARLVTAAATGLLLLASIFPLLIIFSVVLWIASL